MIFLYKYRDNDGSLKNGRTTADSDVKAREKLGRMGVQFLSLWAEGQKEPPMSTQKIPEALKDAITPPMRKDVIVMKDEPVQLTAEEEARMQKKNAAAEEHLRTKIPALIGPPPELLAEAEKVEMERTLNIGRGLPSLMPSKEQVDRACPRRVQSLIIKEKGEIEKIVNDALDRKRGKVISLSMLNDTHGAVQVAVVLEYDDVP